MPARILVVDDHDVWRRHVSDTIRQTLDVAIVGEVADGLEAVEASAALQPDLILLDVGLPTLNGLDAARRMATAAPGSRILFLTQHASPDVAEVAMDTGAHGYVIKSEAAFELEPAIRRVLDGRLFIGSRLRGRAADWIDRIQDRQTPRWHEIELCADDAATVESFATFAEAALAAGRGVVLVATEAHLDAVQQRLQATVDLDAAIEDGRFTSSAGAETLAAYMVDGVIDESRFWRVTEPLIVSAGRAASAGAHPRVAAAGELAPTLWRQGYSDAAIRLERLWDHIARTYDVDLLCAYPADVRTRANGVYQRICDAHSAVH